MKITYVTLMFAITECEIRKSNYTKSITAHKGKDDLEYWKPNFSFYEILGNKLKRKNKESSNTIDKPVLRQREIRSSGNHEGTIKWPKILRPIVTKAERRITKMQMMQDRETKTTIIDIPAEESHKNSDEYFSSYSIYQQLQNIAKKIPHSNVTVEVIGRTVEYQDIVLLKITKEKLENPVNFRADDEKYADETPEKKIIFIVHGLNVMGVKEIPCFSFGKPFLTLMSYYIEHLDKFDIFLIPMANPDGYAMIQPPHLLIWNKNAAPQSECLGVALDRNFDVAWSTNRSISSCSQEYPGVAPFSEAETRAIRDIFHKYSHKIVAFINVHAGSYDSHTFKGDAVLYPKGYTESLTDEDKYIDLKGEIDEAIRNASFQVFSVAVDTLYNWYGRVTGSSVDYASTVYGIPFGLELVMQVYNNDAIYGSEETYTESALTEVWSRVIDVIFKYIWKVLNKGNEVR